MKILGMLFLFMALLGLSGCNQSKEKVLASSPNPVLTGAWVVSDKEGNKFDIVLNKDGTATSTWSVLSHGKWEEVSHNKAHIHWSNGANEFIIVDERGKAHRQVFPPGAPINGKPETSSKIERKE